MPAGRLRLRTDGASRGNPGHAGIGVVLESEDGSVIDEIAEYVDRQTNNVAEYMALARALDRALELGASEVEVFSDSELMVRQVQGAYEVKNAALRLLFTRVEGLARRFRVFRIQHVPRAKNKRADALANQAIDRALGKSSTAADV